MDTQIQTKILNAKEVRERALQSRKDRMHQYVGELDALVAAAIENNADKNEVSVSVDKFPEEAVHRTIHRLMDAEYKVANVTFLGKKTLKISW